MERFRQGSLPLIALAVILVWALAAVLMLTVTLVTAYQIDERVGVINNQVTPIDRDLDSVKLAGETGKAAVEIRKAAQPLAGQLAQVVKAGDGIEASAVAIDQKVDPINATVKTINGTAKSINATVNSIGGSLTSVEANANEINSSVHGISASLRSIPAISIQREVVGINRRADVIIGQVRGIKGDTGQVDGLVIQINENAAAIKNSPLLLNAGGDNPLLLSSRMAASEPAPPPVLGAVPELPIGPVAVPDIVGLLPGAPAPPPLPVEGGGGLLPTGLVLQPQGGLLG